MSSACIVRMGHVYTGNVTDATIFILTNPARRTHEPHLPGGKMVLIE